MDGNNPPYQVVIPSQLTKQPQPPPKQYRPLSVDEAWKFTPLTTSPLPPTDQLAVPNLSAFNRNARVASKAERNVAASTKYTPAIGQSLQKFLNPEELAEIKFKGTPISQHTDARVDLSPLARHILDNTNIDYRFSGKKSPNSTPRKKSTQANGISLSQANGATPSQRFTVEIPPRTPQVVVKIPQPSEEFRRDDYAAAPDSPKRRKLNNDLRDVEAALRLRTQREQGDAAVLQFQDLLLEIFEYQDRFQLDLDNGLVPEGLVFFESLDDDDDRLRLATPTLEKVQAQLKSLVDLNRLSDILTDHLKRLQALCEISIETSHALNLRLAPEPSDDDLSTWQSRLRKAENGAAASCVFLYTALGVIGDEAAPSAETLHLIPNLLVNVYETCLIPVIESRKDGQQADLYSQAVNNHDSLKKLLDVCRKLLDLLALACVQVSSAVDCVSATSFLAAKLIFVQNAATEKSSALGFQNYERVRKQAMFCLARLYTAYPEQRSPILDEILSSLDKLPSTSRSARQYKLRDGNSIMLITALFMQLVQTTAMENTQKGLRPRRRKKLADGHAPDDENDMDVDEDGNDELDAEHADEVSRLSEKANQLFDPASRSGQEIVMYMVGKASKVSKTGDSPYRNVLDLFVEDLVAMLPLPEWPAAELLLRMLAARMTDLATNEKAAGIKNMALESLGTMGSAIAHTRATVRDLAAHLPKDSDGRDREVAAKLASLTHQMFATGLQPDDVFCADGLFAITCGYYDQNVRDSLRAKSARSYFLAQYAKLYCLTRQDGTDEHETQDRASELLEQLSEAALDSRSSSNLLDDSRLASLSYQLIILSLSFCRRYESIVRTLLASLSSEQAQVRSRSVKSVVTILEKDESLLDRDPTIADDIFRCASDDSAMVRDAALSLIARHIITRPNLEQKGIRRLLECAGDDKIGVQKRSIGHLADIYTRDKRPSLKATIARTFLRRTADTEESINELAKRTLTDAWFSTNLILVSERADLAKSKIAIANLASHIIDTLAENPHETAKLFTNYLIWLLKIGKTSEQVGELLKRIVEVLFQSTIDGSAKEATLLTLMAIAEARPQAVAPQQLTHLKQYLGHIKNEEDLLMFRSVIGIYRHVLPRLSMSHQNLLQDIQGDLLQSISKMFRRLELDEIMICLRTIISVLNNSRRLVNLLKSIVDQIGDPSKDERPKTKLIRIVGSFGKHIDLDQLPINGQIPAFRGSSHPGSAAGFLVDVVYPYAVKSDTDTMQLVAIESLGAICQSWPAQFNKPNVKTLFHNILACGDSQDQVIGSARAQVAVLKMFQELFSSLAIVKDEPGEEDKPSDVQDLKKMGGSAKAQDDSSALSTMANYVYKQIVNIALTDKDEKGLLAIQVLSSVAERGMFHPKDYAHVFLALETSSDPAIREAAEKAHQLSHQHHESHWEREYVNAVRQAFVYQQKHSEDPSGSWHGQAKLASCFKVVDSSGSKYVKKFISTLISRLSTDYTKLEMSNTAAEHLLFVRFVAENIAFFDYTKQDDLLHTILQLELLFSKNGAEVSQAIETNLPKVLEPSPADQNVVNSDGVTLVNGEPEGVVALPESSEIPILDVDEALLKRLASASCAVTMISEAKTYLKRLYGVSRDVKAAMQQKKEAKEAIKTPLKVHGITGHTFLANMYGLAQPFTDPQAMVRRCQEFHDLITVDDEVKVGEEGDEFRQSYSASLDPEAGQAPKRGKKRKSEAPSAGGTPKKPRGRLSKKSINGTRRSSSASSREDPEGDYWE